MSSKTLVDRSPFSKFSAESKTQHTCASAQFEVCIQATRTSGEQQMVIEGTVELRDKQQPERPLWTGTVAEFNELCDLFNWASAQGRTKATGQAKR